MNARLDELEQLLNNVAGSYPDFVTGILLDAKNEGIAEDIILFIKSHEAARTGEIIGFVCELCGWTEPLPIVGD